MICDYQTDKVYLADGIKGYPKVAERLLFALYSEGIKTEYFGTRNQRNMCGCGIICRFSGPRLDSFGIDMHRIIWMGILNTYRSTRRYAAD